MRKNYVVIPFSPPQRGKNQMVAFGFFLTLRRRELGWALKFPYYLGRKKQCLNLDYEGQPCGHQVVFFLITWRFGGHQVVRHWITRDDLMATRFPSGKKK
jgi:hypothetical protein